MSSSGVLAGIQLQPQQIALLAQMAGFKQPVELVLAVAVCLAESEGHDRAHCDNYDGPVTDGKLLSRDCGLWQINIPARQVGTQAEERMYDHQANAAAAFALYRRRGFQPWVSFDTGIATDDRYLFRAWLGVANLLATQTGIVVAQHRNSRPASSMRSPVVTLPQLRHLYPHIDLGG